MGASGCNSLDTYPDRNLDRTATIDSGSASCAHPLTTKPTRDSPMLALRSLACLLVPVAMAQDTRLFDTPVVVLDQYSRFEAIVDLDGDSFPDGISWWFTENGPQRNRLVGLRNAGDGSMEEAWEALFEAQDNSTEAALVDTADFDGDGADDYVLHQGRSLVVYGSRGMQAPVLIQSYDLNAGLTDLRARDVNGDGLADIVTVETSSIRVRLNQGPSAGFDLPVVDSATIGNGGRDLRLADLSGDGVLDLALLQGGSVHVAPITAAGDIGPLQAFDHGSSFTNPMLTDGDLDGDGDADLVVFEDIAVGAHRYSVLRNGLGAGVSLEASKLGGPATELADIDGDGDLDGICCGGGYLAERNNTASTFHIAIAGEDGFAQAFTMPGLGSQHIAGAADMDQDGDLDLVAGRAIYFPDGPLAADPLGRLSSEPYVVSDFDGDGDPDFGAGLESLGRNMGNGTMKESAPTVGPPPTGFRYVGPGYLGDFDGDGDDDLVVGYSNVQNGALQSLRFLANQGAGYLLDQGDASEPGADLTVAAYGGFRPEHALVADADGDGDLDLTLYNWPQEVSSSELWLNDGLGSFTFSAVIPDRYPLAYADLTGDGLLDMVCATHHGFGISPIQRRKWDLGTAPGEWDYDIFLRYFNDLYGTHLFEDVVKVFDFDGDGDLDVGMGQRASGWKRRYIHINNQSGGWQLFDVLELQPRFALESEGIRFMTGDLDLDGIQDMLSSSAYGADVASVIHRGLAAGGVEEVLPWPLMRPRSLADVDGDGDLDAVGDHIYFNRTRSAEDSGSRRQYGVGKRGTGGAIPMLGALGTWKAGEEAIVRITGGLGGGQAQLFLGTGESAILDWPAPGHTMYVDPWLRRLPYTLSGPQGAAGAGSHDVVFTVPASFAGVTLYYQVFGIDPGAATGFSQSQGLELSYR